MENEQLEPGMPSYWPSVFIAALIVALITSVLSLVSQYMTISSEPTGSSFNLSQMVGVGACLIAAIGGIISTRHYAQTYEITFPIGKGAIIGLLTGIVSVLIGTVITLIWTYVIDTELTTNFYNWQVANLEARNMPQEQLETAMGFIPEPESTSALLWQVGIAAVSLGILNLITGIIGAKIFAKEEE